MNPADIKRMTLVDTDRTGIRKKQMDLIRENKIQVDEHIEIGNALDSMTRSNGWAYVEAYIFRMGNRVLEQKMEPEAIAEVRGAIGVLNYIKNMIRLKDELLRSANEKE